MNGKLIIIEAGDGAGKATQTAALVRRLEAEGKAVRQVQFPDYESDSSALVRMYLAGKFGDRPDAVNAYAASTFYAADRYASFQTVWRAWYERGDIIVADRYTMSNMVHQAVKIADEAARKAYLDWLWDFEFVKLGLPVPDAVVFLDMPPEFSRRLIAARAAAAGADVDIHERDDAYLVRCYEMYRALAKTYDWHIVPCIKDGRVRSVDEIHETLYQSLARYLHT